MTEILKDEKHKNSKYRKQEYEYQPCGVVQSGTEPLMRNETNRNKKMEQYYKI